MKADVLNERQIKDVIDMQQEVISLIRQLCAIPAPSHREERRAAFIEAWYKQRGMDAYTDEALNVIYPMDVDAHEDIVVFMAHSDTVFPDMEPMALSEHDGRMYCPGVGDDTTNLAAMMMLAAYLHDTHAKPSCGILFVADSCEEGLGNLKGCKAIMNAFGQRVKAFISLDGSQEAVCCKAVGSARYRITAKTKGGHSFADFGSRNAIAVLSELIVKLYAQCVPQEGGSVTTYNVGIISGGTSVNTIAQEAQMLYEYRSDDAICLDVMEAQMRQIIESSASEDAQLEAQLLGLRPCGRGVDPKRQEALERLCAQALYTSTGIQPAKTVGSTDCNIPLSMGIPSACFGVYIGEGEHTREEWIDMRSICPGMWAALRVMLSFFEVQSA